MQLVFPQITADLLLSMLSLFDKHPSELSQARQDERLFSRVLQ